MAFNIIEASRKISEKYRRYLKTMFDIKDLDYKALFKKDLKIIKYLKKALTLMSQILFIKVKARRFNR